VKEHTTIAVDLSKSVFELAVSRKPGRVCQRVRLSRSQMTRFFVGRPPATVLLEACGSSARNQRGNPLYKSEESRYAMFGVWFLGTLIVV
jgi:hypothetical protein